MAVMSRLLPMVAFSTFAIFVLALLATPVNALANEPHAHIARGHDSIAKRKRNAVKRAKRCRPQSSSLAAASTSAAGTAPAGTVAVTTSISSTHGAAPTTTKAPTTTRAATTTTQAATTSVSSGGGSGGGANLDPSKKLLLAWPNGATDLEKYTGKNVGGLYTWSPYVPANADKLGIPAFPQLWGAKQKSDFTAQVKPSGDCGLIFGFNEPNQEGQSDMSPQDGAALWKEKIEPLRQKGCKLVSPATTSAPSGKKWVQDMLTACNGGCTFDYVGLHWYDVSIDAFKAYVTDFHTTFGKPIIVSEYACQNFNGGAQCTKDETWNLHQTMVAWFKQTDWVAMYAPFGFMHEMQGVNDFNQLMASNGNPTDLGYWYLNN
ncbi:hypothetical protein BDV93DRAFT_484764 [Ceratobasidium sp. AG-I]|nr:hypothetical protein BDV93DRAFT_484764 [Ceratobasidium sp. AG-I]